ncbi:hypothetical protein PHMEG_00027609 [Phytophthora megakarya]|uniref:Uncharacterized protein n=1 Tax=Phytophthora megakarya TaxID=4795 RepID=A0A225V7H4_9STRA|nr:hypothetical protein PHMEG_00027609 [Phytophthora megakarya]
MRILNSRVPTPIPAKLQIQCLASEIARFADYMNPQHPWNHDYNLDRVKRNDRLRTKYPYICWKWSLKSPPPVNGMIPEFLCEPSMPLYGMEYLTWIPKTPMRLKEVAELDAREPWRNYWLDCPGKHPYNTTFYPCNPDRPRFVPVGHSLASVGPLIIRDPALTNAEIVGGWGQTFQGSSPVVKSLVAYDPAPEILIEPADPPELLLLDRLMARAKDTDFTQDTEDPVPTSREEDDEVSEEEESEQEEIEEPPPVIADEDEDSSTQII